MPPRIFIVAGETSGDIHAASLIREILRREPDAEIEGLGGPRMEAAGCRLLTNMLGGLDVMWFGKFAGNLKRGFALQKLALDHLDEHGADVVVLVDYPGFNLHLAKNIEKRGVPIVYYIAPQIWAWWLSRWKKIKRRIARVLVIFPFERDLYEGFDIPVEYVGHPMFDHMAHLEVDEGFEAEVRRSGSETLVALLPGTREQHIRGKLPVMLKAARRILNAGVDAHFVVPCVDEARRELIREQMTEHDIPADTVLHRTYELMRCADLAITASGTTTLELAHFRTPMVVIYRVSRFEMLLARLFKRTPLIAMINILAGREIVPEFLMSRDEDERVAEAALEVLQNDDRRKTMIADIDRVMTEIEHPGASQRAAEAVLEVARGLPR